MAYLTRFQEKEIKDSYANMLSDKIKILKKSRQVVIIG